MRLPESDFRQTPGQSHFDFSPPASIVTPAEAGVQEGWSGGPVKADPDQNAIALRQTPVLLDMLAVSTDLL